MAKVLAEGVQFTVYRPRTIQPEQWRILLVFAHLSERVPDASEREPDPVAEVARQARKILGGQVGQYQGLTQDSTQPVPREGELTIVPELAGVEFNPRRFSFLWEESVHRAEFRLRAGKEMNGQVAKGRVSVFLGSIIIAQIALSIRVDRSHPLVDEDPEPVRGTRYRKIFASYSHLDHAVVEEFERYARALGDEYIRDVVHLRSGEVWSDRLLKLIERASVFQLFWSSNSMRSPFVIQEWRYALSLRREEFVRPVYWEEPLPEAPDLELPPQELRSLHFQRVFPVAAVERAGRREGQPEVPAVQLPRAAGAPRSAGPWLVVAVVLAVLIAVAGMAYLFLDLLR